LCFASSNGREQSVPLSLAFRNRLRNWASVVVFGTLVGLDRRSRRRLSNTYLALHVARNQINLITNAFPHFQMRSTTTATLLVQDIPAIAFVSCKSAFRSLLNCECTRFATQKESLVELHWRAKISQV
jgi:nitroimidazol reductase NimA-like FMN-containing flavoprotein (pyridoxamine 5'-phosphate oxidase superfamily)